MHPPVLAQGGQTNNTAAFTFAQKVAALREFFNPPTDAALPVQVQMMNSHMGLSSTGSTLQQQVDMLIESRHHGIPVPVNPFSTPENGRTSVHALVASPAPVQAPGPSFYSQCPRP